jgi:hypothetical protein
MGWQKMLVSVGLLVFCYTLTRNGAQDHINDVLALRYAACLSTASSLSRIFRICCSNDGSHAYSFSTLIPLSTYINRVAGSLRNKEFINKFPYYCKKIYNYNTTLICYAVIYSISTFYAIKSLHKHSNFQKHL